MSTSTPPKPSFPNGSSQSITVQGFTISTRKLPILNSSDIDAMIAKLGITPPEMIFGNNEVKITHPNSGWEIVFNALDALDLVDKTGEGGTMLKVAYSEEWTKMREKVHEGIKEVVRPFDWSYTTNYKGTTRNIESKSQPASPTSASLTFSAPPEAATISAVTTTPDSKPTSVLSFTPTANPLPLSKLKQPDPILFFDEVVLYEDELADNGISLFSIKVRVMPARLLLLSRFFLRLDGVLYRIRDTRIYIEFQTGEVMREYTEREGMYKDVAQKLRIYPQEEIPSIIRDSNHISELIPVTKCERAVLTLK